MGKPGREMAARHIPRLREAHGLDVVVANGENAAGGLGITPRLLDELFRDGVDAITLGNHTWRKKELAPQIDEYDCVARPANYAPGVPGQGSVILEGVTDPPLAVLNLIGRVYMDPAECPFIKGREEVERLREVTPLVLVDFHGEATAEKVAMGWHLDGKCTAVVGTHTHVPTADERVLPGGTAYITDVGMTGPLDSVIGMERSRVLRRFITGMPEEFRVATERPALCGVIITADPETGKALSIKRVQCIE